MQSFLIMYCFICNPMPCVLHNHQGGRLYQTGDYRGVISSGLRWQNPELLTLTCFVYVNLKNDHIFNLNLGSGSRTSTRIDQVT